MPRPLIRAPIAEALIDLHSRPSREFESLDAFAAKVRDEFPEQRKLVSMSIRFDGGAELQKTDQQVTGYQLWSADKTRVIQARLDGFAYSQLSPYRDWESLTSEGRRLWNSFHEVAECSNVTRYAVRYINRILLPIAGLRFEDYLHTFPKVGWAAPQALQGLMMRLVLASPEPGSTVVLTEAFDAVEGDVVPLLLDIDVFVEKPEGISHDAAWSNLELLRKVKNDVFFSSVTDKALELFR